MSRNQRLIAFVLCLASVALCFSYAYFRHVLPDWWRSHGGGIPYVLFFIFLAYTAFPRPVCIFRICAIVVLVTCGLEVLQLWKPEPLVAFRRTTFGAALLGSTFVWGDFPLYFIGGVIGYGVLRLVSQREVV